MAVGSRKTSLQDIAIGLCFENNIHIDVQWIPRCENEKADYFSRIIDGMIGVSPNGCLF